MVAKSGSRENRAEAKAVSQVTGDGSLHLGGSSGVGSGCIRWIQQNMLTVGIWKVREKNKTKKKRMTLSAWGPNNRQLESEIIMKLSGFL